MMVILNYIFIYLSIILGSIAIAIKFKKRIEQCIMVDIFIKIVFLYLFGLIGHLQLGAKIILYISILFGIFMLVKNRKSEEIKNNILTDGLMFFTILYAFLGVTTYTRESNVWDEYSYWSLASKNMFYHNSLLNYDGMKMNILYPPVPTIWQYFFTTNLNVYNQGLEIFATQIISFSILLQFYKFVTHTSKKIVKMCIPILIICIPAIFAYLYFYQAIYVDALIGILIGYIFIQLYKEKDNKFLYLSLGTAFFMLSFLKLTGFYIALILLMVIFLQKIIENYIDWKKTKDSIKDRIKKEKNTIILLIFLLIIAIVSIVSWNFVIRDIKLENTVLKCENIDNSRPLTEGIKSIFTSVFGSTDESYDLDTANRTFIKHLYQYKVFQMPNFEISIMLYIILIILINLWIYKKLVDDKEKNKFLSFTLAIKIGLIIYLAFLEFAYITKFSIGEMLNHSSVDRYINTYLLGEFIFIISVLLKYFNKDIKTQKIKYLLLIIIIILITPLYMIADVTIFFGSYNVNERLKNYKIENIATNLKEKLPKDSNIYVIHQNCDKNALLWKLKYFMVPEIDIDITQKMNEELESQYKERNQNLKDVWIKLLIENYEYLYIIDSDEYFKEFAKDIFETEIKDSTLYNINKLENGNILLQEFIDE